MTYLQKIAETATFLKNKGIESPEIGIVLGTGLGKMTQRLDNIKTISYSEIPHFPVSTVEFHAGNIVLGTIGNKSVICMQGRFHAYEGYSMQEIAFPIRVMHALGIKHLFLSNAAGGINTSFKKGDLVLLDDHINLQNGNPLVGLNDAAYGSRFPDMSQPYNIELGNRIKNKALGLEITLKEGVYASVLGPNLETRAEYRFLKIIGADMVGMSTVPEVIVANQIGVPCAAISVITDECDPENLKPVDISEIIAVAGKADEKLSNLLTETIKSMG